MPSGNDTGDKEVLSNELKRYYAWAVDLMLTIYGADTHFYIFCVSTVRPEQLSFMAGKDNEGPLKKALRFTVVDAMNELDTLYLMSMCSLGCINSKSTLSWWGNYLNREPTKIFLTQTHLVESA
jgi:hypothetical protein